MDVGTGLPNQNFALIIGRAGVPDGGSTFARLGCFAAQVGLLRKLSSAIAPRIADSNSINAVSFHRHINEFADPMERVTAVLLFACCAPNRRRLDYQYEFVNYCSPVPVTSY